MFDEGLFSKKGKLLDEKIIFGELNTIIVNFLFKGGKILFFENNLFVKRKRVEVVGFVIVEKNLIRKRIVDMLLGVGWRIEYRFRNGREYNDVVYVNFEGKIYWLVIKVYNIFKLKVEEGKVGIFNFCFVLILEEVLRKLFRVVFKTRCDKNKKKKYGKGIGDFFDEEFESVVRGKRGIKYKNFVVKRKFVRNGK